MDGTDIILEIIEKHVSRAMIGDINGSEYEHGKKDGLLDLKKELWDYLLKRIDSAYNWIER